MFYIDTVVHDHAVCCFTEMIAWRVRIGFDLLIHNVHCLSTFFYFFFLAIAFVSTFWHYLECNVVQVRKKSARLMEMEESDQLEQQMLHRQSRSSARKSRGSEHIVREIPASSLSDGNPVSPGYEKPVRIRFSLGAKQDDVDVPPVTPKNRSKRDRKKSAAEIKIESDEELVVDEPSPVACPPSSDQPLVLRMKLNMDLSGMSSFGSIEMQDSHRHSVCYFFISFTVIVLFHNF